MLYCKRNLHLALLLGSLLISFIIWNIQRSVTPQLDQLVDVRYDLVDSRVHDIVYPTKKSPSPVNEIITTSEKKKENDKINAGYDQIAFQARNPINEWQREFEQKLRPGVNPVPEENVPLWLRKAGMEDPLGQKTVFMGELNKNITRYAVFSSTTTNRVALGFAFYIPLTVLAWHRIGFGSIVIIVGAAEEWNADPLLQLVLTSALEYGAFFIFLQPRAERSVMISQLSRIFAANIINSTYPHIMDSYILTSDCDLWPLKSETYELKPSKRILALNSECCGGFVHRNEHYKMIPMANIGMKGSLWNDITTKFFLAPTTTEDIITFVLREFGNVAFEKVHKGDNSGWFLDQRLVSVLVQDWNSQSQHRDQVQHVGRDVGRDRIDRAGWDTTLLEDKTDAHLPEFGYIPSNWAQLRPLLLYMYGSESDNMVWCERFFDKFTQLYLDKFRQNSGNV